MISLKVLLSGASLLAMAFAPYTTYETGWVSGHGSRTLTKGSASTPGLLSGFRLEFSNGDHEVKQLGMLHTDRTVTAALADNDGNDPFAFRARYRAVPARTLETESLCREGRCTLNISPPRANETFVLRGFMFHRLRNDANIESISVEPNPGRGTLAVSFVDRDRRARNPDVRVTVEYAYVSNTRIRGTRTQRSTRRRGEQKLELDRSLRGPAVLQGFSFRFTNGDHHLKQFAIEQHDRQFQLMFNDNNTDDSYDAKISYAVLN